MRDADVKNGGFEVFKGFIEPEQQRDIVNDLRELIAVAPLFSPMTPYGKPMRVRMTSAGRYGWMSDRSGYRYVDRHPNGTAWPAIPDRILGIWRDLISDERMPDCCLVNFYDADARMGLHQDRDEADFSWPVLLISLGDDALFRMGGEARKAKTSSVWLHSGDVVVMGGQARLCYHGIDRIRPGTSQLLSKGGRLNLTLRVVD